MLLGDVMSVVASLLGWLVGLVNENERRSRYSMITRHYGSTLLSFPFSFLQLFKQTTQRGSHKKKASSKVV